MTQPAEASPNPLFETWATPFETPPFDRLAPEHFRPAFDRALSQQKAEIAVIAGSADEASFNNTLGALERSGRLLRRVGAVFFNLAGAHTNDALQAIERELAPLLSKHRSDIFMNEALYRRVAALYGRREELGLSPEQARVLERYHTIFVRAGAQLGPAEKQRLAAILERLATLGTQFSKTCSPTRRPTPSCSTARPTSPGSPRSCAKPQRARRRSAGSRAST
jgi:peptidyl-dipeptidase Dcp